MKQYKVTIKRLALAAMLMNGLEAFLLPMKNKPKNDSQDTLKGHEVFGHIFGKRTATDKQGYRYEVEFVNFDVTSRSSQNWVKPNSEAMELKKSLSDIMLPKMKLLGNIHTHPYLLDKDKGETMTDIYGDYMWQPSKGDIKDYNSQDFQLDLILAVVEAKKILTKRTCRINENCIQFNIDNVRFCMAAYIRRSDETEDYPPYINYSDVYLNMPEGLFKTPKCL